MTRRRKRTFQDHLGGIGTALAVLLYLALLAGPGELGPAAWPLTLFLTAALAGLGLYALQKRYALLARLRADAPSLLLAGLIALAFGLRLLARPAPAPAPGSDEAHFVAGVLGLLNPQDYPSATLRHPTVLLFLELVVAVARFLAGVSTNLWTWPTELVPAHLYGWGRGLVALLGAAALLPAYWLGTHLYGRRAGLLTALLLALVPMHVVAGAIVSPEVPAALLALLAVWFSLRLLEEGRAGLALAAGVCAGLGGATHYPAALVGLVPLLAVALRPARPGRVRGASRKEPAARPAEGRSPRGAAPRWALALLGSAGALAGFLVGCPAALLQTDRFIAGLGQAVQAYFPVQGGAGTALRYLFWEGMGPGAAVLAGLGLILLLPRFRPGEGVLFLFPVLLYLALLLPRARFVRDLAMLSPWVALLAAYGLDRAGSWLQSRRRLPTWTRRALPWAVAVVAAALFAGPLLWG